MSTYTSFTNDTDRQVVADLDSASLGLRYNDPSDSIFTAGKAAMGVLPEMMQLGEVMKSRAALNDSSMEKRRLIGADQRAVEDQGVFDAYAKDLDQLAGITDPAQRAQALADMNQKDPRRMLNKDVQESMKVLRDADKSVTDAANSGVSRRQAVSKGRDLDYQEANRDEDEEIATNQRKLSLEQSRVGLQAHKNLMADANTDIGKKLGTAIGGSRALPQDVAEGLLKFFPTIKANEESEPFFKAVADLAASHSLVSRIQESYQPEINLSRDILLSARNNKINLDAITTVPEGLPDAARKALIQAQRGQAKDALLKARFKELAQVHGADKANGMMEQQSEEVDRAIDTNIKVNSSKIEFAALEDFLRRLPSELGPVALAAETDPAARVKLQGLMDVASFRAAKTKESVEAGLAENIRQNDQKKKDLELVKIVEGLKSVKASRENASAKLELETVKQEALLAGMNFRKLVQALSAAKNTQAMKKLKTSQQYIDFANQVKAGMFDNNESDTLDLPTE